MRYVRLAVAAGSVTALSIAAACGIQDGGVIDDTIESGVQDNFVPPDTTVADTTPPPKDVNQPDTTPPPSCADASACLLEFDGGWVPYLHLVGNGGCPSADGSVRADYLDMNRITFDNNACSCGNCATSASCSNPTVSIGTNNKCDDLVDGSVVPADAACADLGFNVSAGNLSIAVSSAPSSSCSVAQTGNQAWDAAVASVCSSSCDFDFCTAPKALYERCAMAPGIHACPAGYSQILLDRPSGPASCTACSCEAGATCSGTLSMFNSADCTGSVATTTPDNQGCVDAGGTNVRSAIFDASMTTTCKASGSDASLAPTKSVLTLCCK
jgi:hypothetical protein